MEKSDSNIGLFSFSTLMQTTITGKESLKGGR